MIEGGSGRCDENGTVGADAFGNSEAEVGDGRGAMVVPVVEVGARLAGDGKRVFESNGGDEGDTRAFALEQRIGGDGGAVAYFDGTGRNEFAYTANGFKDGAAGIVGRGREFEHLDTTSDAVDAVSEGAASVDGDGEVRGHSTKHIRLESRL